MMKVYSYKTNKKQRCFANTSPLLSSIATLNAKINLFFGLANLFETKS